MEQIDIRDNFPVMNGGDGIILSKRGDICMGWEVLLPPAFRCNEEKYDSLIASLGGAIALLPDYTIIHKQDVFMRKRYSSERVSGFLEKAYEEHFDGREYLDHRCFLWLSFSSKKNVRGGSSGLRREAEGSCSENRTEGQGNHLFEVFHSRMGSFPIFVLSGVGLPCSSTLVYKVFRRSP